MLNFGLWSSSKGMGIIPNLEGLTLNEARTAITNAGFNLGNETSIGNSNGANSSNNGKAKARVDTGSLLQYESTIDFEYYSYVVVPTPVAPQPVAPTPVAPTPVAPVAPPYPNIGSVIAYGAGPNQTWTPNDAYVTWGGSGWGSYKVELGTGVYQSSMTSAGGPPLLFSNLSAGTNYSVTVTLYAGGNWTGASASASTNFTTASVVPTPVAPVTPTPPATQLATPSLSVTSSGYNTYPNAVYANIGVGNYDYQNTYTATMGTQNSEFPEEWNIANMSPNTSYTVYVTASRAGYTSATGSITFTSHYVAPVAPVAPVASNAYYAIGCCSGTRVYGSSTVSASNAYDNVDAACVGGTITVQDVSYNNTGTYPTIECSQTPTPVAPVAPTPVAPVAPTPTAPTPTAWATPLSGYHMCTSADAPNPNMPLCNSQNIGSCVNNSATGASCTAPVAPVAPTPTATCPPNDGRSYTNTRTTTNTCADLGLTYVCTDGLFQYCLAATPTPTAPTPTAPTPTAWATPLSGWHQCTSADAPNPNMPSCNYGNIGTCVNNSATGASCTDPNAAPAPTAPAPTAPAPTAPAPTAPAPTAPAPTAPCVPNCVFNDYVCNGWAATYTYINYGCGGQSACPPYTDDYGCA
jgi:hypothetical protein